MPQLQFFFQAARKCQLQRRGEAGQEGSQIFLRPSQKISGVLKIRSSPRARAATPDALKCQQQGDPGAPITKFQGRTRPRLVAQ
jgi:hypothetical protein